MIYLASTPSSSHSCGLVALHTAVTAGAGVDSPLPGHGLSGLKRPLGGAWTCSLPDLRLPEPPRQGASARGLVERAGVLVLIA